MATRVGRAPSISWTPVKGKAHLLIMQTVYHESDKELATASSQGLDSSCIYTSKEGYT